MIILLTAEDTVASREANGEQSFSQVCNLNTVLMIGEYPLPTQAWKSLLWIDKV